MTWEELLEVIKENLESGVFHPDEEAWFMYNGDPVYLLSKNRPVQVLELD